MSTMSMELEVESVAPLMTGERNFPQYTRPFDSWEEIVQTYLNHIEVKRFLRQPEADRASF
jgi:hypothetical protein